MNKPSYAQIEAIALKKKTIEDGIVKQNILECNDGFEEQLKIVNWMCDLLGISNEVHIHIIKLNSDSELLMDLLNGLKEV